MSTKSTVKNFPINSLDEYIKRVSEYDRGMLFRGVSNIEYEPIPSIGRIKNKDQIGNALRSEYNMLTNFREKSVSYKESQTTIKLAVLAQHHGLPTRLLDWTTNSLVALFFAVRSNYDKDSMVYIFFPQFFTFEQYIDYGEYIYGCNEDISQEFRSSCGKDILDKNESVFIDYQQYILKQRGSDVYCFQPSCVSDRMHAQSSVFTFHPYPFSPLKEGIQATIKIPKDVKKRLLYDLEKNGIHEFSMLPGLDGLCLWLRQVYSIN